MVVGIVLHRSGWRIDYLGMDTPVEELTRTVDARHPDLVVLAATLTGNLEPLATQLTGLAQCASLALAGAGATPQIASTVGARLLTGAPVTEAEILSGRGEGARGRRLRLRGQPTVPQLVTGSPSARPPWRRAPPAGVPAYPQIMNGVSFPQLATRDLGGREVALPAGLPGERNVVLIAFRRDQQQLVDSWVPWLEQRAAADPGLRFVELPALGLQWEPARPAIDGGMAAAIRDEAVRRRTLTVYTDLRRVTVPMGIDDRSTIWLCLVDRAGRVAWRGSGGLDPATAAALDTALATAPEPAAAAAQAAGPEAEQFEMAFDPRFRLPLAALGVTPATAHVTIAADRLVACFGPWVCRTAPANVQEVRLTGPYRWHRAIGPRLSLADHGLTFGSTPARGVCLLFREPVPGIGPLGLIRHPDLTLTAADPERLAATVRRHAGLPGS